ncbi:MAG: hypothetical protein Q9201_001650 [Fulgogasparrea decipioides]
MHWILGSVVNDICTRGAPVSQVELDDIRDLVYQIDSRWKEKELTFAILTSINFPTDILQTDELSDFLIPYASKQLPQDLQANHKLAREFLTCQERVISGYHFAPPSSKALKKHHSILKGSDVFESVGIIKSSKNGSRSVDRVLHIRTGNRFARKLLHRNQNSFEAVKNEIDIMRRLDHCHVVQLVASYTDTLEFGLIIHPIADGNLRSFLEDDTVIPGLGRKRWIRTFLGCLTRALQFLHDSKIHHRDIKPENILIIKRDGHEYSIMFCDFGISKDSARAAQNTTHSLQPGTDRYCAPEMRKEGESHNEKVDIFSLACVFVEMWTVVHSRTLREMEAFILASGASCWTYRDQLRHVREWIKKIENEERSNGDCDIEPTRWIDSGLKEAYNQRPTAAELFDWIRDFYNKSPSSARTHYIGYCCVTPTPPSTSTGSSGRAKNSNQGQLALRSNSSNPPIQSNIQATDRSPRSLKAAPQLESITKDPMPVASFDADPSFARTAMFDIEKCSLEMENTEPLEGESKGVWINCTLRILMTETKDQDPFNHTRLLELLRSKDDSKSKIWQLCEYRAGGATVEGS